MTKTYQIVSMKEGTAAGKKIIRATLTINELGIPEEIDNVTIWDGFEGFSLLKVGSPVTGEIVEKQNGQYVNRSLYGEKKARVASTKGADIGKAMAVKADNIEKAQDRKSDSIKVAAINRDSTILTAQWVAQLTAQQAEWTTEDMQNKWLEMQKWLEKNWELESVPF